jgi:hypothetical protein
MHDKLADRIRAAIAEMCDRQRWFHVLLAQASVTRVIAPYLRRTLNPIYVMTSGEFDEHVARALQSKSLIICGPYEDMCLQFQRLALRGKADSFRPPFTVAVATPVADVWSHLRRCCLKDGYTEVSRMTLTEFMAGYHLSIIVS